MTQPHRIAMWSGPRNISTALMRAWENRSDTLVHDEPFYAHYLQKTGMDHPGAADIIANYPTDWRTVVEQLLAPLPEGKTIYYQKHMTHHMLPDIERDWLLNVTNCFLIRDPGRVVMSLAKVLPNLEFDQTGFLQQYDLFATVLLKTNRIPPVIDAQDVLKDPRGVLMSLCERIGVPFDEAMLSWPTGSRESDGMWGKYWYSSVEKSTGFVDTPYPEEDTIPNHLRHIVDACMPLYVAMRQHAIKPQTA